MQKSSRRLFLKRTLLFTTGALVAGQWVPAHAVVEQPYPFALPPLPYPYNALEPHIDETTMKIHHTKHHQAYINNLNDALTRYPEWTKYSLNELLSQINQLPEEIRSTIRNNAGGHWNHDFFWRLLTPEQNVSLSEPLRQAINREFSSMDAFRERFTQAALSVFGSGWTWLVMTPQRTLRIISTPNQDNPLMDIVPNKGIPIMGVDVWEHAYYLKYQNRRADYLKAFWNVVNWKFVSDNFLRASK